jgi:hypothetical protein
MDPNLVHNPDWTGVVVYVAVMVAILVGTAVFYRSRNGDWVDEHHGQGSIADDWGLSDHR